MACLGSARILAIRAACEAMAQACTNIIPRVGEQARMSPKPKASILILLKVLNFSVM